MLNWHLAEIDSLQKWTLLPVRLVNTLARDILLTWLLTETKNLMKHTLCKHGHFSRWLLDGHFAKKEVEPLVFTSAFIFIPPRDYDLLCHGCLFGWRGLADSGSFPFRENRIERWVSEILLLGWRAEIYFHTTFRPAMPDFFQV